MRERCLGVSQGLDLRLFGLMPGNAWAACLFGSEGRGKGCLAESRDLLRVTSHFQSRCFVNNAQSDNIETLRMGPDRLPHSRSASLNIAYKGTFDTFATSFGLPGLQMNM